MPHHRIRGNGIHAVIADVDPRSVERCGIATQIMIKFDEYCLHRTAFPVAVIKVRRLDDNLTIPLYLRFNRDDQVAQSGNFTLHFRYIPQRLSSPSGRLSLAGRILVIITLMAASLATWHGYEEALASSRREIRNLGITLAEQTARSMQAVDLVLQEIQAKVAAEGIGTPEQLKGLMGTERAHRLLVDRLANLPQADLIALLDSEGKVVNDSRFWPAPDVDFSNRDYFIHLREHDDRGVVVSAPVQDRFNNNWIFFLARRINGLRGEFLGVIIGAIEVLHFEDFYRAITLREGGSVAVYRKDGMMLIRYPHVEKMMGQKLAPQAPFYALVERGGGASRTSGHVDGLARVVSVHPLRDYPLVVKVSFVKDAALADWRRQSLYIWVCAAAGACGFALLFGALAAQSRRLERQTAELAHAAEALSKSEERLRRAQQVAHFGSSTRDLRTDETVWSGECYRIFGVTPETFKPSTPNMLAMVHFDDRARLLAARSAIDPKPSQFRIIRPDGSIRHLHRDSELIRNETGTPIIQIATIRDVTEEVLAERQLRDAKSAAEAANLAKSQFFTNMSHELRTPLNAIIGFSEMLAKGLAGPLRPKQEEYALIINSSGTHLLDIINDVLDLAKIDAGKVDLNEEEIDPTCIVNACFQIVRELAESGALRLSVEHKGPIPMLRADSRRLKQILLNLVSNAIKFTEPGGSVTVVIRRADGGGMAFEVRDTGQGMTEAEIELALEPFGQVDAGVNRRHQGTGLGLPLAQSLAELHGGSLHVHSEKGRGTTVSVSLPAGRVLADLPKAPSAVAKPVVA